MSSDDSLRKVRDRRTKNIVTAAHHATIREHYSFIHRESSVSHQGENSRSTDGSPSQGQTAQKDSSWQERMVEKYHRHLFKEFALADLSVPGRIGLRWRTREEVLSGRGERTCGNKRCKNSRVIIDGLVSLEVPFSYEEHGIRKKELVKLKLCASCRPLLQHSTKYQTSTISSTSRHDELQKSEGRRGKSKDRRKRKSKDSEKSYKKQKKSRRTADT